MKKKLIKYAVRLLAVVISFVIVFVTVKSVQTEKKILGEKGVIDYPDLSETDIVSVPLLENDRLALYTDENYSVKLIDKATGKIWSSSLSEDAQKYFSVSADAAISSAEINYLSGDNTVSTYNSFIQSVNKQQARLYKTEDGIRVTYIFGERTSDDIIPQALTEKRYKEIYKTLNDEQKDFIKRRYQRFSADTMTEADNPNEKYKTFSKLKDTPLYIISDVSGKVIIRKTKELFEDIGYTREDYERDNELTGFDSPAKECVFKISYDLKLSDNDLIVTLPISEISFYNEYPMLSVTPLRFFTSSYNSAGEIIVPAGSGSVMSFDKTNTKASFAAPFYGEDGAEEYEDIPAQMLSGKENNLSMPVYFYTEGNNTVMTVIEKGAEAASLTVERDVNSVYAHTSFDIVQNGYSYLTEKKKTLICGSDSLNSDIQLRYRFIEGSGYVKAAEEYKKYLIKNGLLKKTELSENPLTLLETFGAVKNKGGNDLVLTTMSDAEKMLKELSANGARVSLKLNGMNSGGLYKQIPGEYSFNKKLGDQKKLASLNSLAEKNGGRAYLQLNHLYYYNHTSFDGYSVKKNTSKTIEKDWAVQGVYDPVEGTYNSSDRLAWVISPKVYKTTAEKYIKEGFKSVGIGDFASLLNSDYNTKSYYDRREAGEGVIESLKLYDKAKVYVAAETANIYSLPYLDLIEEMPVSGSNATLFDKSIPLYQMIIHGSKDYTSVAVNGSANPEETVLKAIETGSGVHFALNQSIDFELFKTEHTALYSTSYSENRELALSSVEKVNKALKGLNDKTIVSHSCQDNVALTVYENGTKIYVNYNSFPVNVGGNEVPARDYMRVG